MTDSLGSVRTPPAARVDVVREERFGIALADPYRWMEDANCDEMREWLSGQVAYATSVLADRRHNVISLPARPRRAASGPSPAQ